MTQPILNMWPPWDLIADPSALLPPEIGTGGVRSGFLVPPLPLDNGGAFTVGVLTGMGFYFRVAEWTLSGSIKVTLNGPSVVGSYAGPINLPVPAVDYPAGNPLQAPVVGGLALHGGWYGESAVVPSWIYTPATGSPEPYDPGLIWFRLGEATSAPGSFADGSISFEPRAQMPFCSVGQKSASDDCVITSAFDPLGGGDDTGFQFRFGADSPFPFDLPPTLSGSLTLNPTRFYNY